MNFRPIKTKRDYSAVLKEIESLWDAREGTKDADRLELLIILVQAYEAKHYPIPNPDPIELIKHVMESRELSRKDLEPFIGSRARVTEVLNRQRPLTLAMIRRLADGLKLPADVLIAPYDLRAA
jgi:HTH-type transcriptional regulator/antitoxin HigA